MSSKRFFGPILDGPAQGKWWESDTPTMAWYVRDALSEYRYVKPEEVKATDFNVKQVMYEYVSYILIPGDEPVGFWWPMDQLYPRHEELIRLLYYGFGHKGK